MTDRSNPEDLAGAPSSEWGAPSFRVLCERVGKNERPERLGTTHYNTKRTGELSEAAFLLKAQTLGFHVAKPWGDSEFYDFILDSGRHLWRVQLKCTQVIRARGYDIQPTYAIYGQGKVAYTSDEIDVLVAHIVPVDAWYVLPVGIYFPSRSLRFYPDIECRRARWENYREAWDLLREEPKSQNVGALSHEAGTLSFRAFCERVGVGARDGNESSAPSPNCRDQDWRRCLRHIACEIARDRHL